MATDERIVQGKGTDCEVMIASGRRVSLQEAQEYIGGYVEVVRYPLQQTGRRAEQGVMLVDEDGGPKGLSPNPVASQMAGLNIVGKVISLTPSAAEGWV